MICHKYKCIFIHAPRTGGTSIEFSFGQDVFFKKKHLKASEVFNEVGEKGWRDYFKFTFVRNPWDRVVSLFCMPAFKKINLLSGKDLVYFLNHYKPYYWEHGAQCSDYIDRDDLDFIGKFESRSLDLKKIQDVIKCPSLSIIHQKKTDHKHYTEYYDDETKQIVAEKYAKDIEYFGYEFGE